MIGQCGITMQEVPEELVSGGMVPEIGYLSERTAGIRGMLPRRLLPAGNMLSMCRASIRYTLS